jgi:hypothetical protein
MLQLVKNEKQNKLNAREERPNLMLVRLNDESLSPVAEADDFALIAQYAPPTNGDLVAYQHDDETHVRWWHQVGSTVRLTDAAGNEQIVGLADILVLGVVREIRRKIVHGAPHKRLLSAILMSILKLVLQLVGVLAPLITMMDLFDDLDTLLDFI